MSAKTAPTEKRARRRLILLTALALILTVATLLLVHAPAGIGLTLATLAVSNTVTAIITWLQLDEQRHQDESRNHR